MTDTKSTGEAQQRSSDNKGGSSRTAKPGNAPQGQGDQKRSASNPSLPPEGSRVPHDGRTATGAGVGAPAAPASGKPTKAPDGNSAAVENQTNPNAGTGAQVIGSVPDRVTVNQLLSQVLGDVESVLARVQTVFGSSLDTSEVEKHLIKARDVVAKEVGLEKTDAGWVAAGSRQGNPNLPAALNGQTDSQRKRSEARAARR